ncbi:hypothetical protein [Azoarcus sp. DD4]|uniref:hypothetical protein n=1 Tax=Azoarcus sp. DD4 TaxID=2027405 RepID=UPI001125F2CB|nr:hypothetical protein [Azoarcus sp. DD4]
MEDKVFALHRLDAAEHRLGVGPADGDDVAGAQAFEAAAHAQAAADLGAGGARVERGELVFWQQVEARVAAHEAVGARHRRRQVHRGAVGGDRHAGDEVGLQAVVVFVLEHQRFAGLELVEPAGQGEARAGERSRIAVPGQRAQVVEFGVAVELGERFEDQRLAAVGGAVAQLEARRQLAALAGLEVDGEFGEGGGRRMRRVVQHRGEPAQAFPLGGGAYPAFVGGGVQRVGQHVAGAGVAAGELPQQIVRVARIHRGHRRRAAVAAGLWRGGRPFREGGGEAGAQAFQVDRGIAVHVAHPGEAGAVPAGEVSCHLSMRRAASSILPPPWGAANAVSVGVVSS